MLGPEYLRQSLAPLLPSRELASHCDKCAQRSAHWSESLGDVRERRLDEAEDVDFKTFPVLLAVPMEAGIIAPMLAMLSQKLNLGFLPRLACHNKTVEGSRSGKFLVIRERSIPLAKKGL